MKNLSIIRGTLLDNKYFLTSTTTKFMHSPDDKTELEDSYNFLVVAALQEELNEFYKLTNAFEAKDLKEGDAYEVSFSLGKQNVKILTYTPNKMGMPFNAAAIMNIVNIHNPTNTFMIGTCAGLIDKDRQTGDVLIPNRIFSYESGKYEEGKFRPDHMSLETGNRLRKHAELIRGNNNRGFQVFTDEDFFCGAAVINDEGKRREIIGTAARKVTGLDMESYSIACINSLITNGKELLVIKGISDFAVDKSNNESKSNKSLAMENSAKYTLELIRHLQTSWYLPKSNDSYSEKQQSVKMANSIPLGTLINIKGSNGSLVSSEDGKNPMRCNRRDAGPWEKFLLIDAGNGLVALRNGAKYVSSEDGAKPITCNRSEIGSWEKFEVVYYDNGKVGFRGNNNCFISSENGIEPMSCSRPIIKKEERFEILFQNEEQQLIDVEKQFLLAETLSNSDIKVYKLKRFENDKEVGDKAEGEVKIEDRIIKISRVNDDGRILIKILKYLENGVTRPCISKRADDESFRLLTVKFQAKVTGGQHNLFIICKHTTSDKWINDAFLEMQVSNLEWKDYTNFIRVPCKFDFFIDLVDRDVKGSPSSLLLKEFTIYEEIL